VTRVDGSQDILRSHSSRGRELPDPYRTDRLAERDLDRDSFVNSGAEEFAGERLVPQVLGKPFVPVSTSRCHNHVRFCKSRAV
jgi:hypothetical protein